MNNTSLTWKPKLTASDFLIFSFCTSIKSDKYDVDDNLFLFVWVHESMDFISRGSTFITNGLHGKIVRAEMEKGVYFCTH